MISHNVNLCVDVVSHWTKIVANANLLMPSPSHLQDTKNQLDAGRGINFLHARDIKYYKRGN